MPLGGFCIFVLDKAKPSVRRGRKAAGLSCKMAELPKDRPTVSSAFLFPGYSKGKIMKWDDQKMPIRVFQKELWGLLVFFHS